MLNTIKRNSTGLKTSGAIFLFKFRKEVLNMSDNNELTIKVNLSDEQLEQVHYIKTFFGDSYTDESVLEFMFKAGQNNRFKDMYENMRLGCDLEYRHKVCNELLEKCGNVGK